MNRRPTLHDVAQHAGVSFKTVSRVVNGSASVSDALRERIEASIATLHYVPNLFARSLKVGSTSTIGVIVDTITDPFFAALASAVESRALAAGLTVVFGSTGFNPERERQQVERMAMQRVRALVLAPVTADHTYLAQFRATFPIVLVDRQLETPGYDLVAVDDEGLTHGAVNHLLERGHRRIAFLGDDPRFPTMRRRRAGYERALSEAGIAPDAAWAPTGTVEADAAAEGVRRLLALPDAPTAFFAANPRVGMGVVHGLHTAGRTDAAMISFGDFPLAKTLRPAITCVNQDPVGIGYAATDLALAHLESRDAGEPDADPQQLIVATDLIPRGSGEITMPAAQTSEVGTR